MGQMMADGQVVGMINYYPLFFDQSFVRTGADPSAWAHTKVAEGAPGDTPRTQVSMAVPFATRLVGQQVFSRTYASKEAEHIKEVPPPDAATPQVMGFLHRRLTRREPPLPRPLQKKLAGSFTLGEIWSTLHLAGIELQPEEFQYMALVPSQPLLAEKLADSGLTFQVPAADADPPPPPSDLAVGPLAVRPDLMTALAGWDIMEKRSGWRPFLFTRAGQYLKEAETPVAETPYREHPGPDEDEQSALPVLAALASLYLAARYRLKQTSPQQMGQALGPEAQSQLAAPVGETLARLKASYPDLRTVSADLHNPALTFVHANQAVGAAQAVGQPRTHGEIYWDPAVLPAAPLRIYPHSPQLGMEFMPKIASVKGSLGLGLMGVPAGYGTAGYLTAKENTYGKIPWHQRQMKEHPLALGLGGAVATGVGLSSWRRWKNKGQAPPQAPQAPPPEPQTKGLFSRAKQFIGGVAKRADFIEEIGRNDSLWGIPPATQDRLLADAVLEHLYPGHPLFEEGAV